MRISEDVASYRSEFLDLEYAASVAYSDFVYDSRDEGNAIRALLFDRRAAEFSPAFSRVLLDGGQMLGMISCLPADALSKCRMRSAYALDRSGVLQDRPALRERMALAGRTLMKPKPGDFYLSRIAVADGAAGKGRGVRLLRHCEAEAIRVSATRICLEVSGANTVAIAFYEKHGFRPVEKRAAFDPATDRRLEYVHMVKHLNDARTGDPRTAEPA